jgi:hypothetical protein
MAITPHKEMLKHRDEAFTGNECYEACSEDRQKFFVAGAWWQGSHRKQFKNRPRPEFNKLWRPIHRLIGDINDMELNSVIISDSDEATDEGAELMQKRWRNDFQSSEGVEASENANSEAIIGGFGCVKVVAKYEDEEDPDENKQRLTLEIVADASSSVRFGAEAIKKDKSDAIRGWHLIKGNQKAFEKQFDVDRIVSFPSEAPGFYNIERYSEEKDTYLAHYYEVIEKTLTEYDFTSMDNFQVKITSGDGIKGNNGKKYTRDELKEMREIYLEEYGEEVPTRRYKTKYVLYALADGEKYITKPQKMPFKRVPLIPRYAYHTVLEGEEYFCGEIRKQLDQEMFHNYFGSALMQIMAKPQVGKPEYLREQIAKHAQQRARDDIDNLPYLVSDAVLDSNNNIVQAGPVAQHQPPQVGTGLVAAGQFLQQQLQEFSGTGQATLPANSSGEAVQAVNDRQDDAFLPIVKNILHSIKGTCECWIPAAQSLYFSQHRKLRVMEVDGKYGQVTTMEMALLPSGEYGPYGNTTPGKYTVIVEQGESYKDQRSAERETNLQMLQYAGTDTEFGQLLAMNAMTLTNGEGGDMMRKVARYKMIDMMISMQVPFEPENDEELQYVQVKSQQIAIAQQQAQAQQQQILQQTAMAEGQARLMEGQAAMQNEINDANQILINKQKVDNDTAKVQIEAAKAGVDIENKQADTVGKQIDNTAKLMAVR